MDWGVFGLVAEAALFCRMRWFIREDSAKESLMTIAGGEVLALLSPSRRSAGRKKDFGAPEVS